MQQRVGLAPSPEGGEVRDPFAVWSSRLEAAVEHVRSDGGSLPLTLIGRHATPSRTCSESLQSHQSLDPMQSTRHPFCQHVVPHTPGTVRPIARKEAGSNLRAQLFVASAALTTRPRQPSIEATPARHRAPRTTNPPAR